jgi:hypothetical protein
VAKRAKRLEERRAAEARLAGERPVVASSTPTSASEAEKLPWLDAEGRSLVAAPVPRPEPPGRMAIGAAPPADVMTTAPANQDMPPAGNGVEAAAAKVVVLSPEDDVSSDDLSQPGANADGLALNGDEASAPRPKARKSSRHDNWAERRRSYGYAGKRRRGDPRPGSLRYNVVQALGGIY